MDRIAACLLLLLAVSGCASSTVVAANAGDVQVPAQEPATKPSEPSRMMEKVAAIETPLTSGGGWACEEKAYTEPLVAFTSRCVRSDVDLFLMAKLYEVPAAEVTTAQVLAEQIYPKNYAKMFDSFKLKGTQPAQIGKHAGLDINVDAMNANGPVRVRERVVVHGARVYILTEIGSPQAFESFRDVRSRWFAETKFRDLE